MMLYRGKRNKRMEAVPPWKLWNLLRLAILALALISTCSSHCSPLHFTSQHRPLTPHSDVIYDHQLLTHTRCQPNSGPLFICGTHTWYVTDSASLYKLQCSRLLSPTGTVAFHSVERCCASVCCSLCRSSPSSPRRSSVTHITRPTVVAHTASSSRPAMPPTIDRRRNMRQKEKQSGAYEMCC